MNDNIREDSQAYEGYKDLVGPYLSKIESLEAQLSSAVDELLEVRDKLKEFDDVRSILEEDIEKFNIEISDPDILRQGKALALRLYQNRSRKYQTWQAEGGKRPKHPMRQMFEDIIGHVVMRKPTWIAGEFRGGLSQYYNDQGELSND